MAEGQAEQRWTDEDRKFMRAALAQAALASDQGEVPVGCVIVRDSTVVAAGSNKTNEERNGTRHAEFVAIDRLLAQHSGDVAAARFNECDLYVTCEPCIMCAGALSLLRFRCVTFGCPNDKFGGNGSILCVHATGCGSCGAEYPSSTAGGSDAHAHAAGVAAAAEGSSTALPGSASYPSRGGLFAAEAVTLLQEFYIAGNPNAPKPHRPLQPRPASQQASIATSS